MIFSSTFVVHYIVSFVMMSTPKLICITEVGYKTVNFLMQIFSKIWLSYFLTFYLIMDSLAVLTRFCQKFKDIILLPLQ